MVELKKIKINQILNFLEKTLRKRNSHTQICKIIEKGKTIGQISFDFMDSNPVFFYVDRLIIEEKFRGMGYATRILEEIKKFSDQSGIKLELSTPISNTREQNIKLVNFYKKFGFEISEQIHDRHKMEYYPR
ncbi:MAG: hypothetical protein HeimC3_32080 [Candidatus Heimdallarchaeota archaeon LC_3]|nr:MAG: hypothetical protein HeimC3_32080 [Candidatus Heimdallarchaeota archaeon LC_3]